MDDVDFHFLCYNISDTLWYNWWHDCKHVHLLNTADIEQQDLIEALGEALPVWFHEEEFHYFRERWSEEHWELTWLCKNIWHFLLAASQRGDVEKLRPLAKFVGHIFVNAFDRLFEYDDELPACDLRDLGLFFRSLLPACDAAGVLPDEWKVKLSLDLVEVCAPVLERSGEGASELNSWLRDLAELKARGGQAYSAHTQANMQSALDGWPRARVVRDLVRDQGALSGAFDMLDFATFARTCSVSFWWRQFVVQRFGRDIEEEREEWEEWEWHQQEMEREYQNYEPSSLW